MTEAIAYYNLGCSYEHMLLKEKAIKSYSLALEICKIHLGRHHPLTVTIEDSLEKAQSKQKQQNTSHILRNYLRKERATSNIFRPTHAEVMYKRIKTKEIKHKEFFSQQNSLIRQNVDQTVMGSDLTIVNQSAVNSPNQSLENIGPSALVLAQSKLGSR